MFLMQPMKRKLGGYKSTFVSSLVGGGVGLSTGTFKNTNILSAGCSKFLTGRDCLNHDLKVILKALRFFTDLQKQFTHQQLIGSPARLFSVSKDFV